MNKIKSNKCIALAGVAVAMGPLSVMAAPVVGGLAFDAPLSIGVWPLGGLGSLVVLSLARVTAWRKQVSRLRQDLDEEISGRRQAEKALAEKEAFFRQVLDTNPNLIFIKDRDARFAYVNQAAAALFGRSPAEIVGQLEVEVLHNNSDAQRYRKEDQAVMDTFKEKVLPEEPLTDSRGRTRWFQIVKRPLVSEDGLARQVLVVATDITERKHAEAGRDGVQKRSSETAIIQRQPDPK
jgi:PAS domain S-box-containing protein